MRTSHLPNWMREVIPRSNILFLTSRLEFKTQTRGLDIRARSRPAAVAVNSWIAYSAVKSSISMTYRLVTTLLTLAYFVGQLAVPPHAHRSSRENAPSNHDARPHFHLSCMTHGDHDHDHDHESDAIYLANGADLSLPIKSVAAPVCLHLVS